MRAGWMAVIAVAGVACGGARPVARAKKRPAAHDARPAPKTIEEPATLVSADRPAMELPARVPDLSMELRWPLALGQHPVQEPQFPVAQALADLTVTWQDLCQRGAEARRDPAHRDQLAYLGAWCSVMRHDTEGAVAKLAPLRSSAVRGLAEAVRADLPNLLADAGANEALRWLTKYRIEDSELLDRLAATYVEIGKLDDARTINDEAVATYYASTEATRCHRLTRAVLLEESERKNFLVDHDFKPFLEQRVVDPTCERLAWASRCMVHQDRSSCIPYLKTLGIAADMWDVLDAYERWPFGRSDFVAWMEEMNRVGSGITTPQGLQLFVRATHAAALASGCTEDRLHWLRSKIVDATTYGTPTHDENVELSALMKIDAASCKQLH